MIYDDNETTNEPTTNNDQYNNPRSWDVIGTFANN